MSSSAVLSLYVPIISDSTSEAYIKKMFHIKQIGKIARVDFVKNLSKNRREAFIHFEEWYTSEEANSLKEDVLNNETKTQFKYNNSHKFWPLLVNRNPNKKEANPNYEILDNANIKTDYKVSLNMKLVEKPVNNKTLNTKHKKSE